MKYMQPCFAHPSNARVVAQLVGHDLHLELFWLVSLVNPWPEGTYPTHWQVPSARGPRVNISYDLAQDSTCVDLTY